MFVFASVASAACTPEQVRACNEKRSHNDCVDTLERTPSHVIIHKPDKECAQRKVDDCLKQCGGMAHPNRSGGKP